MRDFTLGILGGCLTHQPGIQKNSLYHSHLTKFCRYHAGTRLRIRIARDFGLDHRQRLENLLATERVDGILVHVRNVFVRKAPLIATRVTPDSIQYFLHPFVLTPWRTGWSDIERQGFKGCVRLYERKHSEAIKRALEDPSRPLEWLLDPNNIAFASGSRKLAGTDWREIALAVGTAIGTSRWAMRDEWRLLMELERACRDKGLDLIVMGPSRLPRNPRQDQLCKRLDRELHQRLQEKAIPYCSLNALNNEQGNDLYDADSVHLTAAGHRFVSDSLGPILLALLNKADSHEPKQ